MAFVSGFKRLLVVLALIGLASAHGTFAAQPQSQSLSTTPSAKPIDIVFDLDDTLIRWVRPFPDEDLPLDAVPADGDALKYSYQILEGAPEILQSLANRPNVRISFFSLGPADRNEAILKKIILPDGRSAWDIAHTVLSDTDATKDEEKDLTKINPDKSRILIVDDKATSTILEQRKNVIRISPKVKYFYSSVDQKWAGENVSRGITPSMFIQSRNKLAFAEGVLNETFDQMNKNHLSPLDAATQVQYFVDPQGERIYRDNLKDDLRFYRNGAASFHKVNPRYKFTSIYGQRPTSQTPANSNQSRKDVELFSKNAEQVRRYDALVEQLRQKPDGNILRFIGDDGEVYRFKLLSYISSGKTTSIFRAEQLSPGEPTLVALRVPIGIQVREEGQRPIPAQYFISETIQGHAALKSSGVAIPEIISSAYGQFVANEYIPHDFDGLRFFRHPETISPKVLREANQALEEFAASLRDFKEIGDFNPGQIVYDIARKKWTLLDYMESGTERVGLFSSQSPFESYWFKRGLLEAAGLKGDDFSKLSSREKELISSLEKKTREARSLAARIRCVSKAIVGK